MHSYKDSNGIFFVVCSECERGGNGSDCDKCSCGWRVKRFNGGGCFSGILMNKYLKEIKKEVSGIDKK